MKALRKAKLATRVMLTVAMVAAALLTPLSGLAQSANAAVPANQFTITRVSVVSNFDGYHYRVDVRRNTGSLLTYGLLQVNPGPSRSTDTCSSSSRVVPRSFSFDGVVTMYGNGDCNGPVRDFQEFDFVVLCACGDVVSNTVHVRGPYVFGPGM